MVWLNCVSEVNGPRHREEGPSYNFSMPSRGG